MNALFHCQKHHGVHNKNIVVKNHNRNVKNRSSKKDLKTLHVLADAPEHLHNYSSMMPEAQVGSSS